MKNPLLAQLFSFRAHDQDQFPASKFDMGPTRRVTCKECEQTHTEQDLTRSHLRFSLHRRRIPKYWLDIAGTEILHERVVEVLVKEGITGFEAHVMEWEGYDEWVDLVGPKARKLTLPTYFRIEVLGRVDVDLDLYHHDRKFCRTCGSIYPGQRLVYGRPRLPVPGTWDGSDFCYWRNLPIGSTSLCSRRVIDLAAKHGWSGIFGDSVPGVGIYPPIADNWFEQVRPKIEAIDATHSIDSE